MKSVKTILKGRQVGLLLLESTMRHHDIKHELEANKGQLIEEKIRKLKKLVNDRDNKVVSPGLRSYGSSIILRSSLRLF